MVSPARAGMDPVASSNVKPPLRFPRTRGDGPVMGQDLGGHSAFPPHARGWTPGMAIGRADCEVSPARAGMDPPLAATTRGGGSFPRTRGDGPWAGSGAEKGWEFPPHARGWTGYIQKRVGYSGVSPARAGMDLVLRV